MTLQPKVFSVEMWMFSIFSTNTLFDAFMVQLLLVCCPVGVKIAFLIRVCCKRSLDVYGFSTKKGEKYDQVWKLIRFDYGEFEQITPPVFGVVFRSILRINYTDFRIQNN